MCSLSFSGCHGFFPFNKTTIVNNCIGKSTLIAKKYLQITMYSIVNIYGKKSLCSVGCGNKVNTISASCWYSRDRMKQKNIPKIKLVYPYLEAYVYTLKFVSTAEVPCGVGNSILETVTVQV